MWVCGCVGTGICGYRDIPFNLRLELQSLSDIILRTQNYQKSKRGINVQNLGSTNEGARLHLETKIF